jgi:hypothetical protein
VKPLLWKEMRDLRPFLAGAGALLLLLALLCLNRRFADGFLSPYLALMPLLALVAAVGLGASQMARERASKTLDYLLARPIAPAAVVWIKFLAGSVALALLLAAMMALCYIDPGLRSGDYQVMLRHAVGFPQLAAVQFPRFWCVYALTLLLSALVDRVAKAAVAGFACVLALGWLIAAYADLFPFSNIGVWEPSPVEFDTALRLVRDPDLLRLTGFTLCGVAPLVALAAALLFRRSPGRTLSNRALTLGAAALAGAAMLSTYAAGNRLAVLRPVGSMELDSPHGGTMDAGGGMVAVATAADKIEFLDYSDPARPRKAAEARMPLWTTVNLTVSGSRTYILGTRKALPMDELQIAIASATPAGSVQFAEPIPLGAVNGLLVDSVAVAGHSAYVDLVRQRECRIEVYDLSPGAAGRQTAAVVVDQFAPQPTPGFTPFFGAKAMRMRLQGQFLYVTSPSALTAIDIRDPSRPVVTGRTAYHSPLASASGPGRELASDGRWLLEAEPLLEVWNLYGLADPAHPALRGHIPWPGGGAAGSGPFLFQPWRQGALEFRASGGGWQALRYLTDGRDAKDLEIAAAGGYAYTLERVENRWFVSAYRVNP